MLAENLLCEFVFSKAELLAEMTFSLVCKVHVVSVTLLNLRIARLSVQKRFLVLLVRFLRRCMFYVVSLSSRFETAPDVNASKHIKFDVCKVQADIKSAGWVWQLTKCLRGIRNA
ncbi:hypothetical protein BCT11_04390 [Vibrio sp. 10N.222.52.B12]|nr:hypothetical protein BCT11_04390 [Vibrio sp. 10N.222.52.B12]